MATYQLPDGRTVSTDIAFTLEEIQYPSNWLQLSTAEERAERGIEGPLPEPAWYDQQFYWGYDADGALIAKDHGQLQQEYIAHVKRNAGSMLSDTDWMITRSAEPGGKPASAAVLAERAAIRAKSDEKEAAIEATTTTDELAAYITGPDYPNWGNPTPVDDTIAIPPDAVASGVAVI